MNEGDENQSSPHATLPQPHGLPANSDPKLFGGECLEPEQDLLGWLLVDPARTVIACEEANLGHGDFYYPEHRPIYATSLSLGRRGRSGGLSEIEAELLRSGDLDIIGGSNALRSLARRINSNTPPPAQLAHLIADKAIARRAAELLTGGLQELNNGHGDHANRLRALMENLGNVANRRRDPAAIRPMDGRFTPVADRMIHYKVSNRLDPKIVPIGIRDFDIGLGGLVRRGRSTLILGVPDTGKTTFALQSANRVGMAQGEQRTLASIWYLEGGEEDLTQRQIELESGYSFHNESVTDAWRLAANNLNGGRFLFDAGGRRHIEEIVATGSYLKEKNVGLIVIDSSECIDVAGGVVRDDEGAWQYKLRALKNLAVTSNAAVLINAVSYATTVEEVRRVLQGSEGLTDTAALLSKVPSEGEHRRSLEVFHNHNGPLGRAKFTVYPERFGVMIADNN